MIRLKVEPLTRAGFAGFGEVIDFAGAAPVPINQGFAERFPDLARVDTDTQGGATAISLFRGAPRPLPIAIELMERHPLGSQAFYPLQDRDWLIVVAENPRSSGTFRAFRAHGRQGINYARGVWHHPVLSLDPDAEFLIVDRKGAGDNFEEVPVTERIVVEP